MKKPDIIREAVVICTVALFFSNLRSIAFDFQNYTLFAQTVRAARRSQYTIDDMVVLSVLLLLKSKVKEREANK